MEQRFKEGDQCPSNGCGGTLIERRNRETGDRFLGCTHYARKTKGKCYFAVNLEDGGVLSPSEALYGFVGWITTRDQVICAGASQDAAVWADLVSTFCAEQGLPDPSDGWEIKLKPMEHEQMVG